MKNKKFFAPSINTYKWIQIVSSFGIWFMTFYFGYPLWHTVVVCILLAILTWSTHIRGAAIGIEGKWAIHPSQIELANKVFSPPDLEVSKAKRILEELEKAAKEGKGAAQLDGRMIDAASARMAENIVNIDKLINNK